jgi:hypothetical protein
MKTAIIISSASHRRVRDGSKTIAVIVAQADWLEIRGREYEPDSWSSLKFLSEK